RIFAVGRPWLDGEARADPCGVAGMVGVIVREDDALDCPDRRKDKLPQSAGLIVGDAAVDDRRTAAVLEQPEVDMVQLKRQRHRQPTHAGRDFHRRAGRRNIWKGIPKTGHCRGAIYPITSAFPTEGEESPCSEMP